MDAAISFTACLRRLSLLAQALRCSPRLKHDVGARRHCMRGISGRTSAMAVAGAIAGASLFGGMAQAQDTIKVGVLHSLSGTMAISETTLKDTVLMMVDDINKKGGLLGRKVEAVVVDPASDWPLFAEKAGELLEQDHVVAIFGCWTSVSRK